MVITFVFHGISRFIGAHSEYGVLLRGTGWGMLPFAIGSGALGLGRYLALQSRDPCELMFDCSKGGIVELLEQVNALFEFANLASSSSTFQILFGVFTLCYLIATYVWYVTLDRSSNLTSLGAAVSVGIPVVVSYAIIVSVTF